MFSVLINITVFDQQFAGLIITFKQTHHISIIYGWKQVCTFTLQALKTGYTGLFVLPVAEDIFVMTFSVCVKVVVMLRNKIVLQLAFKILTANMQMVQTTSCFCKFSQLQ